jgi:hypothetical protein
MRGCEIVTFFHCKCCLSEKPPDQSPREWARLEFGLTASGNIQVWCVRHDREVAHTEDLWTDAPDTHGRPQ